LNKITACVAAVAALIAAPAFAADMAVKAPPSEPAPIYSWTGFYGGVNAGWSWGKDDATVSSPGPGVRFVFTPPTPPIPPVGFAHLAAIDAQESNRADGAIGGVQVGYNWQATPTWILGIEADIQASGEGASANHEACSARPAVHHQSRLQSRSPCLTMIHCFGLVLCEAGSATLFGRQLCCTVRAV